MKLGSQLLNTSSVYCRSCCNKLLTYRHSTVLSSFIQASHETCHSDLTNLINIAFRDFCWSCRRIATAAFTALFYGTITVLHRFLHHHVTRMDITLPLSPLICNCHHRSYKSQIIAPPYPITRDMYDLCSGL